MHRAFTIVVLLTAAACAPSTPAETDEPGLPRFGLDSELRLTVEVDGAIVAQASEGVMRDHWLASDGGEECADTWVWWLRGGGIFTSFSLPEPWEVGQRYVDGDGVTLGPEMAFLYDARVDDQHRQLSSVGALEIVEWGDREVVELTGVTWCETDWGMNHGDCAQTSETVRVTIDTNDGTRVPAYVMRCHRAMGAMDTAHDNGTPLCDSDQAGSWGTCP